MGNLNPFRYRGYYQDAETGFYYLMSRYYDTVTHRFVNADGYFQTGSNILDVNMNIYCRNNPVNCFDPTGTITSKQMQENLAIANPTYSLEQAVIKAYDESYLKYGHAYCANKLKSNNFKPRKDKRKGSEKRQPTGARERNVAHPNGEEHSRVNKGTNKVRKIEEFGWFESLEEFLEDVTPSFNFSVPNTGDKPIYEKVWDEIVHMFD